MCQRRGADENGAEFLAAEQFAPVSVDAHSRAAREGRSPCAVEVTDRDYVSPVQRFENSVVRLRYPSGPDDAHSDLVHAALPCLRSLPLLLIKDWWRDAFMIKDGMPVYVRLWSWAGTVLADGISRLVRLREFRQPSYAVITLQRSYPIYGLSWRGGPNLWRPERAS